MTQRSNFFARIGRPTISNSEPFRTPSSNLDVERDTTDRMTLSLGALEVTFELSKVHGAPLSSLPTWERRGNLALLLFGRHFGTLQSAADLIFDSYPTLGVRAFRSLNGCIHGLLLDFAKEQAVVFNDRYGLNRVYFCTTPTAFYCSSAARPLLQSVPGLGRLSERGIAEFLTTGCVLQNRSLFEGVDLLPPASAWILDGGRQIAKHTYFSPDEWEGQTPLSSKNYTAALYETLQSVIPEYLQNGPVALSLTGGLDSRLILAFAKTSQIDLPAYSFCGPYRECADVRIARILCSITGQPHQTLNIQRDFFEDFPNLLRQNAEYSDGCMDASGTVELYANRQARQIAPRRVTGNYGSEILRQYVAFRPRLPDTAAFASNYADLFSTARETYAFESKGHRLSFIAFKQVPWFHYSRRSIEVSQVAVFSPFLDNRLVEMAYRVPPELTGSPLPLLSAIALANPKLAQIPTDRGLTASTGRASLVRRLIPEFSAKLEYYCDYGMPTLPCKLEKIFGPSFVRGSFLGRHKFYHFRTWYQHELQPVLLRTATELTADLPAFREDFARKILREHLDGKANHTLAIHALLCLQQLAQFRRR